MLFFLQDTFVIEGRFYGNELIKNNPFLDTSIFLLTKNPDDPHFLIFDVHFCGQRWNFSLTQSLLLLLLLLLLYSDKPS